jgi:uncharacterized damage-inducible protein DinB
MRSLRVLTVFVAAAAWLVIAGAAPVLAVGYQEEGLKRAAVLEDKFVRLAEAIPQEKYTWRPADGVRSVSELLLHVTAANYGVPRFLGTPPPEGFDGRGLEKSTTAKAEIVAKLKESFGNLKGAIGKLSAADADKPVKMFGQETTLRGAVLMTLEHLSEHLGQGIAYARVNGVVPPWSE